MPEPDVAERIRQYNQGRDPERLQHKYDAMAQSAFAFFRGTCHLFADAWQDSALKRAPRAWICGDLHFENFGAYKGDNRLEYFDLNDFDEALLAPCTVDVTRFLASLLVGARSIHLNPSQARALCAATLHTYARALGDGKARWIERDTASGMVKDLLRGLQTRTRKQLLKKRTVRDGRQRRLRVDGEHALPASSAARRTVTQLMGRLAADAARPEFWAVLDVGRRIAGTGSLGVERYVVLVEGKGSPDKNCLIDLKAALPSSLQAHFHTRQPAWRTEAERVVTVQRRAQAIAPALLRTVKMGPRWFTLRELQPTEDRLQLELWDGKPRRLEAVIETMAELTAWAHLRGSGRQGAESPDAFIEFGGDPEWQPAVLEYAEAISRQCEQQWREFRDAFAGGFFAAQLAGRTGRMASARVRAKG